MRNSSLCKHFLGGIAASILLAGCSKEVSLNQPATGAVSLSFEHVVETDPLVFGDNYTNAHGESFNVSAFKYYVTNIQLRNVGSGATAILPDTYFLVDETVDSSKKLEFSAPEGEWNEISFLLGVDSTRNVSGAQTGALDPARGMFWTWNSGYIMVKLEGSSPVSGLPGNSFEYHIGGFSGANSVLHRVSLQFPSTEEIRKETSLNIVASADLQAFFQGSHDLRIADHPASIMPGPLAKQFSENYRNMFRLVSVEVE